MLEVSVCHQDHHFVNATMYAEDIIKMILDNPSNDSREGFICINVIPVVCAKARKKSRHRRVFQYGEDSYDDEVSPEIMTWLGENLGKSIVSKTFNAFAKSSTVEDVCEMKPSKKINFTWLTDKEQAGIEVLQKNQKRPGDYSTKQHGRIGILEQIRQGNNFPLTVRVRVRRRSV